MLKLVFLTITSCSFGILFYFYENTFVPLALDAMVSWFWLNLSHFALSDDGCKVKQNLGYFTGSFQQVSNW